MKKINKIKMLVLVSVLILFVGCTQEDADYPLLGGGSVNFDELQGKFVLVVYWADWCSTSSQAMPAVNEFFQQGRDDVVVLGVNIDLKQGEVSADIESKVKEMGIEFPVLLKDPRSRFGVKSSQVLPEILVIDREGHFQQMLIGEQTPEGLAMALSKLDGKLEYQDVAQE